MTDPLPPDPVAQTSSALIRGMLCKQRWAERDVLLDVDHFGVRQQAPQLCGSHEHRYVRHVFKAGYRRRRDADTKGASGDTVLRDIESAGMGARAAPLRSSSAGKASLNPAMTRMRP